MTKTTGGGGVGMMVPRSPNPVRGDKGHGKGIRLSIFGRHYSLLFAFQIEVATVETHDFARTLRFAVLTISVIN